MKKTINYLKNLLKSEDTVIISCSGGPDSMCLYDILLKLKKDINFNLVCAHINHTRRKDSDKEEEFLKNYSIDNSIPFEVRKLTKFTDNFQQDARNKRYKFLNEVLTKYNGTYIMSAHHGDDLIETILMRLSRGSNLSGYAGFKIKTGNLVKPLIFYTKDDILAYNKKNNVSYKSDKSNKSSKYTRNRYRLKVLKELKKENDNINDKYLKFSEELLKYDNYIKSIIKEKNLIEDKILNLERFLKEDEFLREKTLEYLIDLYQKDYKLDVSDNILREIIKLINSDKKEAKIDLPNDFVAIKKENIFYLKKQTKMI